MKYSNTARVLSFLFHLILVLAFGVLGVYFGFFVVPFHFDSGIKMNFMAAAALCELEGLSLYQTEYAAECAMEHFLGLSCDPVDGYVIIPCIERNGMGALRAYDAYLYAKYIAPLRKNQVSFDDVVEAMKLTGDSLASAYKETAEGGLAEILKTKK